MVERAVKRREVGTERIGGIVKEQSSGGLLALSDDLLITILLELRNARSVLLLREVSPRLCDLIDRTPLLWRLMEFSGVSFKPRVSLSSPKRLTLSPPDGKAVLEKAARAGNAYARLVKQVTFDGEQLYSLTLPQPLATVLVRNCRKVVLFSHGLDLPMDGSGVWIGIHAARCLGNSEDYEAMAGSSPMEYLNGECMTCLPLGAIVGLIHVDEVLDNKDDESYAWDVNQCVELSRPIRCSGHTGLWKMSDYLSELVLRGAQATIPTTKGTTR